jgi:hypothetical protein
MTDAPLHECLRAGHTQTRKNTHRVDEYTALAHNCAKHCAALQRRVDPDGRIAHRLWRYVWKTLATRRPREVFVYQLLCALAPVVAKAKL